MTDTAWMQRTQLLLGAEGMERLANAHVLVVGLGGVGSFAAEMLVRAGVGTLTIVDGDVVDPTNRNRQLPALASTHGQLKTEVMAERLLAINPELTLHVKTMFMKGDLTDDLLATPFDYVVDAIDSLSPKINLILKCKRMKIPLISSMGAAGKTDPTKVNIGDIFKVQNCTLSRYVRKKLKRAGVRRGVKVVYTTELPDKSSLVLTDGSNNKKSFMGTISYLPAIFGCMAASVVIRAIAGAKEPPLQSGSPDESGSPELSPEESPE
ncbi:MAG: tRNA threonylcarbamoyladenosine dehydratase [Candidatus Kapabacteria bacterium]|nr:tRNA threonylcarbamoyladenosine dehydratase [Candidatus Kapabacteria bacterium]